MNNNVNKAYEDIFSKVPKIERVKPIPKPVEKPAEETKK